MCGDPVCGGGEGGGEIRPQQRGGDVNTDGLFCGGNWERESRKEQRDRNRLLMVWRITGGRIWKLVY